MAERGKQQLLLPIGCALTHSLHSFIHSRDDNTGRRSADLVFQRRCENEHLCQDSSVDQRSGRISQVHREELAQH